MSIGVRWGAASDRGRVRSINEDSVLAAPPVFAVADGVGGHAAGEVASSIAVAGLDRFAGIRSVDPSAVMVAVRQANEDIRAEARAREDDPDAGSAAGRPRSMGSTVVGLVLSSAGPADALLIFNVGDSRAFRFSDGRLDQVSVDHSLVEELVRAGHITRQQAASHPRRNVITRALGAAEQVEVDSWLLDPRPGDRYLLCSDGLTNEVSAQEVAQLLASCTDPQEAANSLVVAALEHGGRDNVTVIVVDVAAVGSDAADPGTHRIGSPGSGPAVPSVDHSVPPRSALPDR